MSPGALWPDPGMPADRPLDLVAAWSALRPPLPLSDWQALVRRALAGDDDAARAAGLATAPDHDPPHRLQRLPVDSVPSLADLARVATDMAPDLGNVAPDRLLGPDGLFASRAHRLAAVAAACFHDVEDDPHGRSPFRMWCRRPPLPSVADRARFRAIDRQPHRLVARRGDDVVDLVDGTMFPRVVRRGVAGDGDVWLCRLVEGTDGRWYATVGFARADIPDVAPLRRWRRARLWRSRLQHPSATLQDVMRGPEWVRQAWTS